MRMLALLLALLLIAPVLAQDGRQDHRANDRPNDRGDARQMDAPPASFEGRHVTVSFENGTLSYAHEGTTWFTVQAGDAKVTQRGHQWTVVTDAGRFLFTDAANGHMSYRGDATHLDFGAAAITETRNGQQVQLDGKTAWLLERNQRDTFLTFHVRISDERPEIAAALEDRRLAARVTGGEVEVYDDLNVTVDAPAVATKETPYRVVIGAELPEGRTVVLNVDRAQLQGPDLELRYFDLNDDGTETEVVFRQATDLADVLEPTDDAGQPEYWIVEDENGVQVMVSIPHWSTHAVTLASAGSFVQPQVWLGALAGAVVAIVAGVALFRPSRPKTD
ncbi:MAG: hypothetical protein ACPHK8_06475 [Thermoplasmatota archaeon]